MNLKKFASTTASYLSLNKLYNELRSQGYKLDKNFLYEVNEAAKAVYLSLPVSKFDYSELKRSLPLPEFSLINQKLPQFSWNRQDYYVYCVTHLT